MSGIQTVREVEALLGPDLADDHAAGPHAERLLHEVAEPHFAGALQPLLTGPRRHPVGVGEAEHKDSSTTDVPGCVLSFAGELAFGAAGVGAFPTERFVAARATDQPIIRAASDKVISTCATTNDGATA